MYNEAFSTINVPVNPVECEFLSSRSYPRGFHQKSVWESFFFSRATWLWSFVGWSGFVPSVWFCLFIKDRSLRQCTFSSLQFSLSFSSEYKIDCFHFHMQKKTHSFLVWYASPDICFLFGSNWCKKKGNKKVPHLITLSSPKLLLLFSASDVLPVPACLWLTVIHFLCFLFFDVCRLCASAWDTKEGQPKV